MGKKSRQIHHFTLASGTAVWIHSATFSSTWAMLWVTLSLYNSWPKQLDQNSCRYRRKIQCFPVFFTYRICFSPHLLKNFYWICRPCKRGAKAALGNYYVVSSEVLEKFIALPSLQSCCVMHLLAGLIFVDAFFLHFFISSLWVLQTPYGCEILFSIPGSETGGELGHAKILSQCLQLLKLKKVI